MSTQSLAEPKFKKTFCDWCWIAKSNSAVLIITEKVDALAFLNRGLLRLQVNLGLVLLDDQKISCLIVGCKAMTS